MEEPIPAGESFDLPLLCGRQGIGAGIEVRAGAGARAPDGVRAGTETEADGGAEAGAGIEVGLQPPHRPGGDAEGGVVAGPLRPHEGGAPRIRDALLPPVSGRNHQAPEPGFLAPHVVEGVVGGFVDVPAERSDAAVLRPRLGHHQVHDVLHVFALDPVLPPETGADLRIVPLDGLERLVGQARLDALRRRPEQAVADADVVVEEGERLAGLQGLQPQAHAAELGGHRVPVHAVEAAADHVAERVLMEQRGGLAVARRMGAHAGQMAGEAVGGADQEVAGADSGVADLEVEDRPLRLGPGLAADRRLDHRVEGRVEQALHQRVGRVVGARGLARVAGELREGEARAVAAELGREPEQALVDAAQLLRAEVAVVHRPQHPALADEGEAAERFQEVVVGELGVVEVGGGGRVPEKAAEGGEGEGAAGGLEGGVARERPHRDLELPPQVAVAGALDPARQIAQPGGAVVRGVALAGNPRGVGIVPGVEQRPSVEEAVFRDEEEDQPVHDAQKLAVEVVQPDLPGAQGLAQRGVLRVAGEARAQGFERALDAAAQLPERPRALAVRLAGPSLQPAGLGPGQPAIGWAAVGWAAVARGEAGGVGHEPEQHEVGVDLAREHRLEIEFEPGLTGEGLVVPQDAQAEAVRDDGPQVGVAAVQEFLHQPVRVGGRRAALSGGAAVEREAAAEEVDGRWPEEAADGIGAPPDLGAGGGGQEAEPELAQQRQAPLVVGEAGARFARGQVRGGGAELRPVPAQPVPGLGDGLVQPLAGGEGVILRPDPRQLRARVDQAPQKVGRQQPALGADRLEFLAVAPAGHGGSVGPVQGRFGGSGPCRGSTGSRT